MRSLFSISSEPNARLNLKQIPQQYDEDILENVSKQSIGFQNYKNKAKDSKKQSGNNGRYTISTISIILLLSFSLLLPSIAGYESGLDGGLGTNIADNGCICHGIQNEAVIISVALVEDVSEIIPGESYTLEISGEGGPEETGSASGGFLLNIDNGQLAAVDEDVSINSEGNEATHSLLGVDQRDWLIDWVAGSDDLTEFTIRVNLVDGDGASGDSDDWNMAIYYLKDDGTFSQTIVESEARFIAPEWTQNLILLSSGLLMLLLSAIGLSSKSKGRRRDFD